MHTDISEWGQSPVILRPNLWVAYCSYMGHMGHSQDILLFRVYWTHRADGRGQGYREDMCRRCVRACEQTVEALASGCVQTCPVA